MATELVDSRQPTPIDEDVENQAPIDFSIGDVLRRAREKWHPDGSSKIASGALIQAKKKEYHKEQMKISVEFIDDVIKCLQQSFRLVRHKQSLFQTLSRSTPTRN